MEPHRLIKHYMWTVVATGAAVTAFSIWQFPHAQLKLQYLLLCLVTFLVCSRVGIKIPKLKIPGFNSGVSLSDTFVFLCLLLFDGEAAILLGAAEAFVASVRVSKKNLTRVFNAGAMALSTFVTVWGLRTIFGSIPQMSESSSVAVLMMATGTMALLQYLFNSGVVSVGMALRFSAPLWETWKKYYLWTSIPYFAGASTAVTTLKLMNEVGLYGLLALGPIVVIIYFTYSTYLNNIESSAQHAEKAERHAVELQESEERFRSAFDNAPIGMALVAPGGRWLQVNRSLCQIVGYTEEELLASNFQSITHPSHLGPMMSNLELVLTEKIPTYQMEKRYYHKHGHEVWVLVGASLAREGQGNNTRLIFQIQDITDRKKAEEKLLHEAFHDSLTQLPNRAMFMDHLRLSLERAKRASHNLFAVLFIDLDRFKIINDSLGHAIGDQLLIEISNRLQRCLRPGDTVARLGGDEFTILLEDIKDINEAIGVAERVQQEVSQHCELEGYDTFTTASIGIALYNQDYQHPADLLRDADTAMYRAKSAGKAQHVIFDSVMHAQVLNRMKLEADLRRGIERQEFFLHYQPIICLQTNRLVGFEALVRWQHPERGMVSPAEFIPVAEETGAIIAIGQWVLEEALRQTRQWHEQYPSDQPLMISVNLSGKQFTNAKLFEQIVETLSNNGFPSHYLKLEITESVVMDNFESATRLLKQLRTLGVQLSIDDFGTGYSSLSNLHRLPLTTLKVDRSFVSQMTENNENLEIVRTIILLAKNLKLDVIAEGLETPQQMEMLRELNCNYGQGYLFSRPVAAQVAEELIRKSWQATYLEHHSPHSLTARPASLLM
ncbi:MAG TPA: EAL domain-containing protein [Blastocatellia bacterium]|nr:EAL domain-containing protein [Blastocatellia bacterium]